MGRFGRLFEREPKKRAYKTTDVYDGLRKQALQIKPEQMGFGAAQRIIGVMMETGYPEGVVTMVALADGTASLYFSGGGGFIGGGGHPGPDAAARVLVGKAVDFESACAPTSDFPLPRMDHTRFYIIERGAVLTAEASEDDLGNGRHRLSPLFHAAQDVITQIRLVSEKARTVEPENP